MSGERKIKSALISVFHKDGLEKIVSTLHGLGVKIYSTGGTEKFIQEQNIPVTAVEDLTGYPSILGGRVKTLHPKIFGGILARRENQDDLKQISTYEIPQIDLVIVDLYPFEDTVASGASEAEIIEKIDIGGISLIRAAAKNYKDVTIISNQSQYTDLQNILTNQKGITTLAQRQRFAAQSFQVSSHYDTAIFNYFNQEAGITAFKQSISEAKTLRYGENPHQKGIFYGKLDNLFEQLHGKELSYNNLLDIDAAVNLISDFENEAPTIAILKHNNACGLATRKTLKQAWIDALAGDPTSAFGGIIISNKKIDSETAEEINKLFCEVVIAPDFDLSAALEILKSKKNRILLKQKTIALPKTNFRSALNGVLFQEKDNKTETLADLQLVTETNTGEETKNDLIFANKIVKHTKSNTIVLAKNNQLIASGTGQTSRVDALKHAIEKAAHFNFDLKNAVMASDAFFPFPDCVEIAYQAGISAVIQPGGSINDKLSIEYCNKNNIAMFFTGIRHFKH